MARNKAIFFFSCSVDRPDCAPHTKQQQKVWIPGSSCFSLLFGTYQVQIGRLCRPLCCSHTGKHAEKKKLMCCHFLLLVCLFARITSTTSLLRSEAAIWQNHYMTPSGVLATVSRSVIELSPLLYLFRFPSAFSFFFFNL